jgi:hypothetical protein
VVVVVVVAWSMLGIGILYDEWPIHRLETMIFDPMVAGEVTEGGALTAM